MKVNLSYSVELADVLAEVEKLYEEHQRKFEEGYNASSMLLRRPFTNSNLRTIQRNLEDTRDVVSKFEGRLGELQGMLNGYRGILEANAARPAPEAPEDDISDEIFLENE